MAQPTAPGNVKVGSEWESPWESFRWRVPATILGATAWLSFTLLYVGFWAKGFSLFQSVIVIFVSIIVLAGLLGALWASWGVGRRHVWD